MPPKQCLGVTVKGTRCLKKVADGSWCNYHVSQSQGSWSPKKERLASPQKPHKKPHAPTLPYTPLVPAKYSPHKPGFIYVYTLQSFLHDRNGTVKTRNLVSLGDKWVDLKIKDSKILLIKVGMTTKTPAIRILQWESKCNHKLLCLYPNSHDFKSSSFLDHFRRLSLKSPAERYFLTFQENNKGFYVPREVLSCERDIHGLLKLKFGRGEIHCTGCVEKTNSASNSRSGLSLLKLLSFKAKELEYNVHNEWFPVPKSKIHEVYSIIDSVCKKYR